MKWKLNCQETTTLVSQSLDEPLSWYQKLALKLHLSMCHLCSRYHRQLQLLQRMTIQSFQEDSETGESLSQETKAKIKENL